MSDMGRLSGSTLLNNWPRRCRPHGAPRVIAESTRVSFVHMVSGWQRTRRSSVVPGRHPSAHRAVRRIRVDLLDGWNVKIQGKSAGRPRRPSSALAAALKICSTRCICDVLVVGHRWFYRSRVACSNRFCIGFLGAGIIIFRRGLRHERSTAAAIWGTRCHRHGLLRRPQHLFV